MSLAIGIEYEDGWYRGNTVRTEASGIVLESDLAEVIAIHGLQNLARIDAGSAGCGREEVDSRSEVGTGDTNRLYTFGSIESPYSENHSNRHERQDDESPGEIAHRYPSWQIRLHTTGTRSPATEFS